MKNILNYLFTFLCLFSVLNSFGQSSHTKDQISLGISSGIPIFGDHNATYEIIHSVQLIYHYRLKNQWRIIPQIAFINSPYNKNFKLSGFQAITGVRYQPNKKKTGYQFEIGVEHTKENFAFDFMENNISGSISNTDLLVRVGTNFPLFGVCSMHPFLEFNLTNRTMIGISIAYPIFKI